ncbi:MAG: IclR family transcriptional regulator [Pseudomonadota bacterium]
MSSDARIPTNLRTLLILEVLGKSERPMTATEINSQLGLPKQTVHRLCNMLEGEGFLTRYGSSLKFQASRRLRNLGAGLLNHSHTHIMRHQILEEVAALVGETVNFAVPGDGGMSYADRVETDWAFRIQLPVGSHVPFHCTASGKCFLASLPTKQRNAMLSTLPLEPKTENTLIDRSKVITELDLVRRQGYALDREEFIEDMIAIAVPVKDRDNRFLAALAFHGPTQRISIEYAIDKLSILQSGAQKITDALFPENET